MGTDKTLTELIESDEVLSMLAKLPMDKHITNLIYIRLFQLTYVEPPKIG